MENRVMEYRERKQIVICEARALLNVLEATIPEVSQVQPWKELEALSRKMQVIERER